MREEEAAPVFLHGGGPAGPGSPRAVGAAGDGGGSSSPTATSQAVAVLCTALAAAGAASPQLLRAAAELLMDMARGGSAGSRGRSGTADGFAGEERGSAGAAGRTGAAEEPDEAAGAVGPEAAVAGGPAAGPPRLPHRLVGRGHAEEVAAVLRGAGLQGEADAVVQVGGAGGRRWVVHARSAGIPCCTASRSHKSAEVRTRTERELVCRWVGERPGWALRDKVAEGRFREMQGKWC